LAIFAAALLVIYGASHFQRKAEAGSESARTATITRKDFIRTVRLHGIVEAVESHTISVPRLSGQGLGSLLITHLIKNGSPVHPGDALVEFDRQAQIRNVLDKQAEYRGLLEQIKKKQAEQAAAKATDETDLKKAEDAEKTAELEVKKNEIVSHIDAEKNLENLEQAHANLKQLQETFELKRRAAKAEMKILEIQRDRALTAMRWSQGNTDKMLVRASANGVAVINSMWKSGNITDIQEGDEVRAGFPFMQVVNPSRMQVRAKVNQADIASLTPGQKVRIGLDAYPELSFEGKLESVAAVAQAGAFSQKVRTLIVLFSIDGTDSKLLPDLSAAVDVQIERQPGVLVAPRDAIFEENGKTYVRVKGGSSYDKREVKTGASSDEELVLSGIAENTVVLRGSE